MAHIKIVSPSGWDFDVSAVSMIKLGSDGRFTGPNDRAAFVKRAGVVGANAFKDTWSHVKFASDEMPVHLIALGAKEAYGPNRNGDGFTEAMLKAAHDTFVKHAFWFRNHKNKPHNGDPKYGHVKASMYNQQMRRVELLCGLPMTKAAADRMGVLVADRECEKLANDEDIAVSMACRVPYDVCSGCGNKARTREEYCKSASCKYGGCHDNLTKLVKIGNDAHILHVENPYPTFFDISNVFRPADRIAYAGKANWITKAASAGWDGTYECDRIKAASDMGLEAPISVIIAQDTMPVGTWRPQFEAMVKLAHGMAALEQQTEKWASPEVARAFAADVQPDVNLDSLELTSDKPEKIAAALGALADQKIILSLRDFGRMTKRAGFVDDAGKCIKGAMYRMIADGSLESRLANNRFAPAEKLASAKQRQVAARMVSTYSLAKEAVDARCRLSVVRGHSTPSTKTTYWTEKKSHDSVLVEELARDYACYKIAALRRISEFDNEFPLTARTSMCQNQVI